VDQDPEVIRGQMDQTRARMNEKLESLEAQVSETMQSTGDTMSTVRQAVQSISQTLDISRHVQQHPWIAVGTSVAAGFVLSQLLPGPGSSTARRRRHAEPNEPESESTRRSGFNIMGSLLGVMSDLAQQGMPLAINALLQSPKSSPGSDAEISEPLVPQFSPLADSASVGQKPHSIRRFFSP
jgi:ElaB/YqjD/DUF883 family membrane-anchored ribosome-binding protein